MSGRLARESMKRSGVGGLEGFMKRQANLSIDFLSGQPSIARGFGCGIEIAHKYGPDLATVSGKLFFDHARGTHLGGVLKIKVRVGAYQFAASVFE